MKTCNLRVLALTLAVLPLFSLSAAQAQDARPVRVDVDLLCEGKTEYGTDEIWIPSSATRVTNTRWDWNRDTLWYGDMDYGRITGRQTLWEGSMERGDAWALTYHVFEDDGAPAEPIIAYANEVARRTASVLNGLTYRASAIQVARSVGAGGIMAGACGAYGCASTDDDYIGSFTVFLVRRHDGVIESYVDPSMRARFLGNGRLELYGDGGNCFPGVDINGVRAGQYFQF